MSNMPLSERIGYQTLILMNLKPKLEAINFIVWGMVNKKMGLSQNSFMRDVAHAFSDSVILDICALFQDSNSQKNRFHRLLNYKNELDERILDIVKTKLEEAEKFDLAKIKEWRDQTTAHKDFKSGMKIHYSLRFLDQLNQLSNIAEYIIGKVGDSDVMYCSHKIVKSIQKNLRCMYPDLDYFNEWAEHNNMLNSSDSYPPET